MQSLTGKNTGDTLTAVEWNQLPAEVQNVITGLGLVLTSGDLDQLGKAIAGYVSNGNFYAGGGVANAYVATVIGAKQGPTAYTDGMSAEFIAGDTNTGASTINVAGLGVKNIVNAVVAGNIVTGNRYQLRYRLATDDFEIINELNLLAPPVAGYISGGFTYVSGDTGAHPISFDIGAVFTNVWASVGPTGSLADNIWTALDSIPLEAKWVKIRFSSYVNISATSGTIELHARKTGSLTNPSPNSNDLDTLAVMNIIGYSGSVGVISSRQVNTAEIPLDTAGRFDLNLPFASGAILMSLVGFGI